jgi:hypothetical protein
MSPHPENAVHHIDPIDDEEGTIVPTNDECQRRRENASAGRSKNALRTDGRSAANARRWFKQRHREISFAVRSMSLLSRPDLA